MKDFLLRPLRETDAERMLAWMKDPSVTKYLRIDGANKTLDDAKAFIKSSKNESIHLHRAVSDSDGQYYGTVSLKNINPERGEAEYAIALHPEAMGTGAARAVSKEILRIAFEQLGLRRVYLNVIEKNVRAVRLYESLGFSCSYATTLQFKENPSEKLCWYEMTAEQWRCSLNAGKSGGRDNMNTQKIEFDIKGDSRGKLVVIEGLKDIPFPIARIFYMYGSDRNTVRGCHANRKSEFVLINVRGTSKVKVLDGKSEQIFDLDKPNLGVYLPKMVWKDMYDFSDDSVLLCLSSEPYDAAEYIRDYNTYLKEISLS